ncbi:MAG: hypothetical protein LRZ84_07625 [Desertifilum sp.]|nr:hypothetical protein [Desertifilum sp.]
MSNLHLITQLPEVDPIQFCCARTNERTRKAFIDVMYDATLGYWTWDTIRLTWGANFEKMPEKAKFMLKCDRYLEQQLSL